MTLHSGSITVSNIFLNMSLGEEPVALNSAEEWFQRNNFRFQKNYDKFDNKITCQSESGQPVQNLIDLLEETRSTSIGLLVKQKYTWNDANKLMDMFIGSLKCYMLERKLDPSSFKDVGCYISKMSFVQECRDIAKNLVKELKISKFCRESDPLLPFYVFLAELCEKAGLIFHLINYDEYYKNLCCPLIITEDADVDSAVESVAQSVCQFNGEVPWSVSHVIIQESLFDLTVKQLENRLKRIKHGSRLDKTTELQYDQSTVNDTYKNLKIFKPHEKSSVKLCIGWNPKDVDKCDDFKKSNGFVVVVPYRNVSDLQTLVKDIGYSPSGSIWSEKISVKKLVSKLNFPTSWINCHGAYHPLHPFINLPTVEDALSSNLRFTATCDDNCTKRFPSAMLSAIKGVKEMQKLNEEDNIIFTLQVKKLLMKYRKKSFNLEPEYELDMRTVIENRNNISLSGLDIAISHSPIGIIVIHLFQRSSVNHDKLLCLILSCIYNRNAVVINSLEKDSTWITELESLLKKENLGSFPKGMINFAKNFDDNFNESVKLITKELTTISCPPLVKFLGPHLDKGTSNFCTKESCSLFENFQNLMNLTKIAKTIWTA